MAEAWAEQPDTRAEEEGPGTSGVGEAQAADPDVRRKEVDLGAQEVMEAARAAELLDAQAEAAGGGEEEVSMVEVTAERLEQLMKSMEVLLADVEVLRGHCSQQTEELMRVAVELRQEQQELKESYAEMGREIQEAMDSMEHLLSTKTAFDTREKQMQKLSRQL